MDRKDYNLASKLVDADEMLSPDDMVDPGTDFNYMSRRETPAQAALRKAEAGKLAGELGSMAADMTPFVGGAKAATELPDDLSYAKALVEEGYDESDIKKMGLGGAFTALSILGLLPGVKIGTDVVKAGIKSSVKDQMENLITPKRAEQLEYAKTLPKAERRTYLKEVNRPVPKVFHGSPEMGKITAVSQEGLDKTMFKLAKNVETNKNALLDSLIDLDKYKPPKKKAFPKNSTPEQREQIRYQYEQKALIAKNKARKDRVSIDELLSGPSVYITKPTKRVGGNAADYFPDEGLLTYEVMKYDDGSRGLTIKVDDKPRETLILGTDGKISTEALLETFNFLNQSEARKSGLTKLAVQGMDEPASKAEKLVQEGFQPYDKFEGDVGLGRRQATGEHMELDKKMLSTSRDPLVSLKEGFGEFNPANVVYADLPRRDVKGLSGEDYTDARNYRDASKLSDEPLGLPKSDHLEAEVALSKPEQLGPIKRLSDKDRYVGPANKPDMPEELYSYRRMIEEGVIQGDKSRAEVADAFRAKEKKIVNAVNKNIGKLKTVEDKVLAGQQIANSLKRREQLLARRVRDDYYFPKDMRKEASKKVIASKYYDDVRSYFNDLQSLGQFTEQYGARGTYDKLLEGLSKEGGILKDIETNLFFIRKDLPKEKAENLRIIYNILQRRSTMSSNATLMSDTAGRGITDQQLLKSAKDENLGIFKDAKTIIKRKDGTEKTVDTPRIPDMTGDSEFINGLDYNDLKRLLFLTTQKMNRGGLVQMEKGGVVPMKNMEQQMELFADGGLMDEGGMVDEESGNEVPSGSLREEVRDDIPAQLSEGEFVFPADVVRYFGLEKLMQMRQEAKAGLARMEAMGQMGNADEATLPDDLPFTIDDLDMEDEEEYNNRQEFAVGGLAAPLQNTAFNPLGQPMGTVGQAQAPMQAASAAPVQAASVQPGTVQLPGTQFTPTTVQAVTPTFQETIGAGVIGVDYEMVDYVNEAGQVIQLRKSKSTGEMLDPIPEGYKLKSEQVESAVTTPTTVETARVTDTAGAGDETVGSGASIALGGKAVGPALGGGIPGTRYAGPSRRVVGATSYDVSFKNVGMNPIAFSLNMISKDGGLPPEGIGVIGVKGNKKATIELPAVAYNSLRNDPRGQQAKTVQEALAARDALTSGYKASYVDGVLSVENKNGDMVAVSKDAIDLIGSTMYSEIKDEADGTFGFGRTDNLVDTARDYFSGMSDQEEQNAKNALSAYNDQQFADFVSEKDVSDYYSGTGTLGGKSYNDNNDSGSDNNNDSGSDFGSGDDMSAPICLTEDMKVKLNGAIDFVTNVKVGDIVDNTKVTEVLHKHMREGYYVVNGELKITNDHPVLANGSWKRTEDLVLGDYINSVEVRSLEYVEQVTPTVYIGTADDRYDVYTEGEVYTVHGQYKNGLKKAA